jgi:L-threonylcarbamoyladenylate synthase
VLEAPRLAERIRAGSAALFPTDTLPALAARPQAAAQIWLLKERPSSKPLILMGADPDALFAALEVPIRPEWRRMAEQWWPGALTLVLPASGRAAAALHPQARPEAASLGLRIPACPAALGLLRLTGPLATTSANRSGEAPCLEVATAAAAFPDVPLLGPCPWPEPAGLASTVIAWTAAGWALLRAGAVLPAGCLP